VWILLSWSDAFNYNTNENGGKCLDCLLPLLGFRFLPGVEGNRLYIEYILSVKISYSIIKTINAYKIDIIDISKKQFII
jgi:hypothetical protein